MALSRGPLFSKSLGFKQKVRKVYDYLFRSFPFRTNDLDYDEYWNIVSQEYRPVSLAKLKLIGAMIDAGSSVLDIGCGDGNLLQYLTEEKKIKAHGIDISETAIALARQKGIEAYVTDLNKEGFHLEEIYDYIVISEVLEHLPNPEQLLSKLKGKFRKKIIITVPNTGFLGERLRLLFGRFPKQWVLNPAEHLRFWTVTDFVFWCHQIEFRVESYYGMLDEFYDIKIKLWKYYPRLFSRYVLYKVVEQ